MAPPNTPHVDLVLVFRASTKTLSKQEARDNAQAAEAEYSRLLTTLKNAGLKATGRKGEKAGQLLVVVWSPSSKLMELVHRERHSDFLLGLPTSELPSLAVDFTTPPISPADRLRLVYEYVTSIRPDGGLGFVPGSHEWPRLESVMALHDPEFNDLWIRVWTRRQIGFGISAVEQDKIKDQFGPSVAIYFSFLSTYTHSLLFIALLGLAFFLLKLPYSAAYSGILVIWSIGFVEFWRIRERILSVRWGTRGSFRVEKHRAQYVDAPGGSHFPWWKRELRILASIPVVLLFATLLATLLTAIFVFEAFVTQLYKGPGHKFISFSPTILFVALVPKLLAVYHSYAVRFTQWENHSHQSTYDASLTIKTFALSAIVAYLGLALSAFVYVPFGESMMSYMQQQIFTNYVSLLGGGAPGDKSTAGKAVWEASAGNARGMLNASRLQNQMFAYTVTNQVINTFIEIGLPFVLRKIDAMRRGKAAGSGGSKKKRVVFEDEEKGAKEEREFLERVRREVVLPEYTLFSDYSEMVTQFGYVSLWSTIWPLAPVMALLNNWLELRSDAFKIAQHGRRPIPARSDTIGPWLDTLGSITWLAALTNSALVYLFRQRDNSDLLGTALETNHPHTALALNSTFITSSASSTAYDRLIVPALLIVLLSSHGYIVARLLVRHILERLLWKGSKEERLTAQTEKKVKEQYLQSLGLDTKQAKADGVVGENLDGLDATGFWVRDEGLDEIQKAIKEA